ncbi:serine/threonine protein phosphatase [Companilactobacillus sp. RD055328]|uniref:metallophosphoesterase family protein n=1 Tax=Companilactobacillus sp. RD055328 TaxID=2916634 RepID=UPI001FC8239F|nr:metallophosphoesterase [Companilactobacillus sp. RD055328]GKQ43235.1 serine/threonine protein phosphatase [Companilactobacillus sp. RD055328]
MLFRGLTNIFRRVTSVKNVKLLEEYAPSIRSNIAYRDFFKNYIDDFNRNVVEPNVSYGSFTLAVITDTHAKDINSSSFYGINGLVHTQELNVFDQNYKVDLKAHLGDAIDGSDNPENSKTLLRLMVKSLNNSKLPFAMIKGNHDDNDKFDEHTLSKKASFNEDTYQNIVGGYLYNQPQIKYESETSGLFYFDKGPVRTIFINTSDVPYKLHKFGVKKYDVKKVRAIRQAQIVELISILEKSAGRKIIIFGHSPILNEKGESGLTYNGISLHELFVAFNEKLKGHLDNQEGNKDFVLDAEFDFTNVNNAEISAYICGHKHVEKSFKFDNINHILLNCSALMGKNHGLTTNYNKKWDRKINDPSEFAGYIVDINYQSSLLTILGYGAATKIKQFEI